MHTQTTTIQLRLPVGILPAQLTTADIEPAHFYQALGIWKFGAYLAHQVEEMTRFGFINLLSDMQFPLPMATEAIYMYCQQSAVEETFRSEASHELTVNPAPGPPQSASAYRRAALYSNYAELLEATKHLNGHALYVFTQQWNIENPDTPTSYERVLTLRQRHREYPLDKTDNNNTGNNTNKQVVNSVNTTTVEFPDSTYVFADNPTTALLP